jgi:hypothetical protein
MIINLDVFQEDVKEFKIKGKIYKVPSDIPTILYLELINKSGENEIENMATGMKTLYKIFKIYQPELTEEEFSLLIGFKQYTAILNNILANMSVEETKELFEEIKENTSDGKKKQSQAES